ncbi:MAG TPA: hypothetical protein VGN01_05425 [Acidobacteriaceae bacterium]
MNRTTPIRDAWHPQTRQDRDTILAELQVILSSPHFCNSKRYPALLQYIVEKTLAGESDKLKERTLGVEVFDRPPSYDTNADTVVRYTAGEVRKRLSLYYSELGHKPLIRISLPAGSYVPEFLHEQDDLDESEDGHLPSRIHKTNLSDELTGDGPDHAEPSHSLLSVHDHAFPAPHPAVLLAESRRRTWSAGRWALAAMVLALLAGAGWKYRVSIPKTPTDKFWAPVLKDQSAMMVCIGGSVFSQTHTSGVATATKDVDYPFISIQSAAAAAQVSALLERSGGVTSQLRSAATTQITELREHPVILLGGYNNQWTLRLVQPLRFHFSPVADGEWIVDNENPGKHWERDSTLPYSSADDYALVARFHDSTTDSWVVALAGVGRNGTEAAAQFVTSPHYMELLRNQVGSDFANKNIEAVLKVSVIDGKTGAPSILAVHAW